LLRIENARVARFKLKFQGLVLRGLRGSGEKNAVSGSFRQSTSGTREARDPSATPG
jgi:hypothetical protein